jgi:uncharacterized protein YbjT (DUF2867 family)
MVDPNESERPLVVVAGASGFVGTAVRTALAGDFRFRALTRSATVAAAGRDSQNTEWRGCDLYSLPKLVEAMQGCRYGLYLVHSMAPSSRLEQANFADLDLLLADNFIRAAEEAGLERVIYLGGLFPSGAGEVSAHLASRREVETVLRSRSVPVTVLRAGLIFGAGGSSCQMLVNLVRRLPVMVFPAWAGSRTQSIDIADVARAIGLTLGEPAWSGGTYDLGGHPAMTYRALIVRTGALLGKRTRGVTVPANLFTLSKHWVALFGGVPPALVGPLQESLTHDLEAAENPLLVRLRPEMVTLEESLRRAVDEHGRPRPHPRSGLERANQQRLREERRVRSVQRMPLPPGWDAQAVAEEYGRWLSRSLGGLVNAERTEQGGLRFKGPGRRGCLLELSPTPFARGSSWRCAFYISGGWLARQVDPPGRFEFRLFPENGCLLACIHGFSPRLPWWLYAGTQALIHLAVMRAFGRHLARLVRGDSRPIMEMPPKNEGCLPKWSGDS